MAKTLAQTKRDLDLLVSHASYLTESELVEASQAVRALNLEATLQNREAERDRLLSDYSYFFRQAWEWVESARLLWNWHHKLQCDYLQALYYGVKVRDLVMNVPPGTSKSLNGMVIWPAWVFAKNPTERLMTASYDLDLVAKQSVATKELIRSEWYQAFFGDRVQVSDNADTQTYWETTAGGWRFATTPKGKATGRHPSIIVCFPAGTMIETDRGSVAIETVASDPGSYRVLSGSGFYREIVEVFISEAKCFTSLKHENGILNCTSNHPIWVDGKGWRDASAISSERDSVRWMRSCGEAGERSQVLQFQMLQRNEAKKRNDSVRAMWRNVLSCSRSRQTGQASILQFGMLQGWYTRSRASRGQARAMEGLPSLRQAFLSAKRTNQVASSGLQRRVSRVGSKGQPGGLYRPRMRAMPHGIRSQSVFHTPILFKGLRERSPLNTNERKGKQQLHARQGLREVSARVSLNNESGSRTRRARLSPVWDFARALRAKLGRASHRLRQAQQRDGKPHHALSLLPCENAWQSQASRVLESKTYTASEDVTVYNLHVAVDHTYWANGVLVHNCDDPQNVKQAESEKERASTLSWWDTTMVSRGAGKSLNRRRLILMQRLNEADLTGHVLKTGQWTHFVLPMRYEPNRMADIGIGKDPRTTEGELLWPEMFDEAAVKEAERSLGMDAAGQLQQRPMAKGGGIFKTDRLHIIPRDAVPLSKLKRVKRAFDKAGTPDAGCFTAGVCGGIEIDFHGKDNSEHDERIYVLDVVRGQWGSGDVERQIDLWSRVDTAQYGEKYETVFEREGGSAGIQAAEETLRRLRGRRVRACGTGGKGKEVRWQGAANAIFRREVYLVEAPWNAEFIAELQSLPKGQFKDQADAFSLMYSELVDPSALDSLLGSDDDEDQAETYERCANNLCDRLAVRGSDYCCHCCEAAHSASVRLFDNQHEPNCNQRHNQLAAKGEWEPAGTID
jgi:predicted phage terminase large subunit-like protein